MYKFRRERVHLGITKKSSLTKTKPRYLLPRFFSASKEKHLQEASELLAKDVDLQNFQKRLSKLPSDHVEFICYILRIVSSYKKHDVLQHSTEVEKADTAIISLLSPDIPLTNRAFQHFIIAKPVPPPLPSKKIFK